MEDKRHYLPPFKMRALQKQEYVLLRQMMELHEVSDYSDFFTILIRMAYELHHAQTFNWLENEVRKWKDNPTEQRTYEL